MLRSLLLISLSVELFFLVFLCIIMKVKNSWGVKAHFFKKKNKKPKNNFFFKFGIWTLTLLLFFLLLKLCTDFVWLILNYLLTKKYSEKSSRSIINLFLECFQHKMSKLYFLRAWRKCHQPVAVKAINFNIHHTKKAIALFFSPQQFQFKLFNKN